MLHYFPYRYIYTNTTDVDGETVMKCLNAGKKYCIKGIEDLCTLCLESLITEETVCTIYEQARFFQLDDIVTKCKAFMDDNELAVVKSNDFHNLQQDSLTDFLAKGKLPNNEIDYFEAAIRWAEEECKCQEIDVSPENKRKVLGPALHEIKFGLFTPEEFAEKVKPTGLLTAEEQMEIYPWIILKKEPPLDIRNAFPSIPRSIECNLNVNNSCFKEMQCYSNEFHISLSVSYPMTLTKVETNISGLQSKIIKVSITEDSENEAPITTVMTNMSYRNDTIIFDNGIEMKPGIRYSVNVNMKQEAIYNATFKFTDRRSIPFTHHGSHKNPMPVDLKFGGVSVLLSQKCDAVKTVWFVRTS